MLNLYGLQLNGSWLEPDLNYASVRRLLRSDVIPPRSLIVLPEMFDVGFTMESAAACTAGSSTESFLSTLARDFRSTVIAGHAGRDANGAAVNQASVFDENGAKVGRYIKCHPFTPAGEHEAYAAGDGPVLFDWAGLKVAPLICYDLRFPELFRAAVKLGAEIFIVIANWPIARVEHWVTLAKARAIENQAYVVAVNRSGRDPNYVYPGRSLIIDPHGNVLAEAGDGVEMITAEINPATVRDWRRDFPALRDARFL